MHFVDEFKENLFDGYFFLINPFFVGCAIRWGIANILPIEGCAVLCKGTLKVLEVLLYLYILIVVSNVKESDLL